MSETRKLKSGAYQMGKTMLDGSDPARYRRQLDGLNRFAAAFEGDSLDILEDRILLEDPESLLNRHKKKGRTWKSAFLGLFCRRVQ